MEIKSSWQGKILVAALSGEFDTIESDELLRELQQFAAASTSGVVLDCTGMVYVASHGIGAILNLAKALRPRRVPLRIAGPSVAIRLVMDTVQLGSFVPIDDSVADAIASINKTLQPA